MRQVSGLTVIECKYCYNQWQVDLSSSVPRYTSSLKEFQKPREAEFYRRWGVYEKAGVPITVCEIDYENYRQYQPYEGVTRNFSDAVCAGLKRGDAVLVAGGYCNYAPAVAGGIQRAVGLDKTIGVVWMDAHADMRNPHTAPSPSRLVSVPMSTLTGLALEEYRTQVCGLKVPCDGGNIVASDIRIMDEASAANLCAANIVRLDGTAFEDGGIWRRNIEALAQRVDVIYLSLDADILKAEYIPAYEKAVPYGHDLDVVMRNVQTVMDTGKVCAYSIFCFNFDHFERGGERTFRTAASLIGAGLERWKQIPLP